MSGRSINLVDLGCFVYEHREQLLDALFAQQFHEFAFDEKNAHGELLIGLMELVGVDPAVDLARLDALAAKSERRSLSNFVTILFEDALAARGTPVVPQTAAPKPKAKKPAN